MSKHENTHLTFEQLFNTLINYWSSKGCLIDQGYDLEVGAGTFNPVTFLRSLGKEPYNSVYIEPSRRPQDGRFGKNPNRVQKFHQLQIIMKPSPRNIQDMYLESLSHLGFNLKEHDIRFVHDDWESPTLGAWGLGWEVWLDGMEITQFTYFQSMAGIPLSPITVEITYGLERIAMIIQEKKSIFNIQYNHELSYGDIFHQCEYEWSHYNFYNASTQMWSRHFDDFEYEAKELIKNNLPIPAFDFVLKASHAFNILEARGLLAVSERTNYISRVRDLSKLIAAKYLESREKLNYPLLKKDNIQPAKVQEPAPHLNYNASKSRDYLIEIGSEQLPATFVPVGIDNLEQSLKHLLKTHKIHYEQISVFGTPRRLVAVIRGLSEGTKDETIRKKGPALETAFDQSGSITTQGMGFLRSLKIDDIAHIDNLKDHPIIDIEEIKTKNYLVANSHIKGHSTANILRYEIPKIINTMHFPKKMRWSKNDISYPRPLRWIVSLFGNELIPLKIGSITASDYTFGHMQRGNKRLKVTSLKDYKEQMNQQFVMFDHHERKENIERQIKKLTSKINAKPIFKDAVLKQVLHLCEWPIVELVEFDKHFLKAPKEILTSEMVEHQKYFPLENAAKELLPLFLITVDNNPSDAIKKGNRNVLSARLSDGVFLYEEDLKISLSSFAEKLSGVIFHQKLGTMADKTQRISTISSKLVDTIKKGNLKTIARSAELCKADITSELVQEFPNLQGIIGKYYAIEQNESKEVAQAIEEHLLPKFDGDALPTTMEGAVLSLADKLDSLNSYFRIGLLPTSSSDPFALRRQSIGILKILIKKELLIDSETFLMTQELREFVAKRLEGVLEEHQFKKDEITAVSSSVKINPFDQFLKIKALSEFRKTPQYSKLYEVYRRTTGQIKNHKPHKLQPNLLEHPSEKSLHDFLCNLKPTLLESIRSKNYAKSFKLLAQIQPHLDTLFAEVTILSDNKALQENRKALLCEVLEFFKYLLKFDKLQNL